MTPTNKSPLIYHELTVDDFVDEDLKGIDIASLHIILFNHVLNFLSPKDQLDRDFAKYGMALFSQKIIEALKIEQTPLENDYAEFLMVTKPKILLKRKRYAKKLKGRWDALAKRYGNIT